LAILTLLLTNIDTCFNAKTVLNICDLNDNYNNE